MATSKLKKATSPICPDCYPQAGCLTCDTLNLISTDGTVKIDKKIMNGKCTANLRVNTIAAPFLKSDSSTIQFEGDSKTTPLKAHVKISSIGGNILNSDDTGLFVVPGALVETPNDKTDSPTIAITLTGLLQRNIKADLKISAVAGNAISVLPDGVFVSNLPILSGDLVAFKVGDVGFPLAGQNIYSPPGDLFLNRKVLVFRNFAPQALTDLGDGNTFVTKPIDSNILTFSTALGADDYIIILVI